MLDAEEWGISDADLITYTDASLTGLGFTTPTLKLGFCSSHTSPLPSDDHLRILKHWQYASGHPLGPGPGTWYPSPAKSSTDSLNCVDMFNSLRAQEGYNDILLIVVCNSNLFKDLTVPLPHPGADNCVADALSSHLFDTGPDAVTRPKHPPFPTPSDAMGLAE